MHHSAHVASRDVYAQKRRVIETAASRAGTMRPRISAALPIFGLFVLWALCNPYFEIDRSTLIYSGRALADLDPAGVGRDIMFRYDGQSGFTLFTWLFHVATVGLGPSRATALTAAASVVASFTGAAVLASTLGTVSVRTLAVVFAATLPAFYGGYELFSYAETAATPRPFAEALVLCSLAALVLRKIPVAIVLSVCATAFHPIMALPGVAVLLVWLATSKWAWIALAVVTVGAGVAVWLGVPPFDRLTTIVDPSWREILIDRNPYLFPTLWPSGWIGRAAVRVGTLLVAASLADAPIRKLFLLTLLVGLVGLGLAYGLGERVTPLLLLQAQTWRMMWLVFALAPPAAAICVVELWRRGDGLARIVLMLLALAWAYADNDRVAVLLVLSAVGAHYTLDPRQHPLSPSLVWGLVVAAMLLVVIGLSLTAMSLFDIVAGAPVDQAAEAWRTLALAVDFTPVAVLAAVWILRGRPRLPQPVMLGLVATGAVLLSVGWDQRSLANRYFDSDASVEQLSRIIATKPGEVYWIGGVRENWWWLHRPQWVSAIQGAGIVFSRELAVLYKDRGQRVVDLGLATPDLLSPLGEPFATDRTIRFANIPAFCKAEDAPAWIIAPLDDGAPWPSGLGAVEWTAPVAKLEAFAKDGTIVWRRVSRYAVIPCAPG